MERRNRSIKALDRLVYIDSLEDDQKASLLEEWVNEYIIKNSSDDPFYIRLTNQQREQLAELYYKNILFLKAYKDKLKEDMDSILRQKTFLNS